MALRDRVSPSVATATVATVATVEGEKGRSVARVATVAVATTEKSVSRHWSFRITPEDAAPFEVRTLPEATLAEARELWPGTVVEALPATQPVATEPCRRPAADVLALVEHVARKYRTPPDEFAEMKRLASADPAAAWEAFIATAMAEGIR